MGFRFSVFWNIMLERAPFESCILTALCSPRAFQRKNLRLKERHMAWHPGTERRQLPLFGHCVVARSALAAGAVVVEVPRSSCVLRSDLMAPSLDALAPVYALALALLAATAPGGSLSAYASVLQGVCSAGIGNSLSFDTQTNALLRGSSVESEAALLPARNRWRATIRAIVKQNPEIWPGAEEENFVAAVALVRSRCVEWSRPDSADAPPEPVFVPHLDLFNHSSSPNAVVETVETAGGELTAFRVRTLRAVPAGEQCFISYGQLSDARLLAAYGFTVPISGDGLDTGELEDVAFNPHNEVHVRLADVTAGMRAVLGVAEAPPKGSKRKRGDDGAAGERFGRMMAALERAEVLASPAILTAAGALAFEERCLKALPTKKGGKGKAGPALSAFLPNELVTAVRAYLLVTGSEEQFDDGLEAVAGGSGAPSSDAETEERALRAVLLRCVERYPTSLNDDLEWLGEYLDDRDAAAAKGVGVAAAPARGWTVPASGAAGAANARIVALGEKALLLRWWRCSS